MRHYRRRDGRQAVKGRRSECRCYAVSALAQPTTKAHDGRPGAVSFCALADGLTFSEKQNQGSSTVEFTVEPDFLVLAPALARSGLT